METNSSLQTTVMKSGIGVMQGGAAIMLKLSAQPVWPEIIEAIEAHEREQERRLGWEVNQDSLDASDLDRLDQIFSPSR